jgi:hypothetical protein
MRVSNGCDGSRGHKPQEGRRSRERCAKLFVRETLKWGVVSRLRLTGQTPGGEVRRRSDHHEESGPGGEKTQESYVLGFSLNR